MPSSSDFAALVNKYAIDHVEVWVTWYPPSEGINVDVGEYVQCNVRIQNKGDLGLLDVRVLAEARHGVLSQSYFGHANVAGGHWLGPWTDKLLLRPINVAPKQTVDIVHESSGGKLFCYQATSPTAGSPGSRQQEELIRVSIKMLRPDIDNIMVMLDPMPTDAYVDHIQYD